MVITLYSLFGDNYKGAYCVNYNTPHEHFSSTLAQSRINPSGARYARILDRASLPEDLVEHEALGKPVSCWNQNVITI